MDPVHPHLLPKREAGNSPPMTINDMRRIFREEMRLDGFKKVGSITWMLEFDEISWVYTLSKDRYRQSVTLMVGIDVKCVGDGSSPTNYIDCPIHANVFAYARSIGLSPEYSHSLFDEEFTVNDKDRDILQRTFYRKVSEWSTSNSTLSSIQSMVKTGQLPNLAITKEVRPIIEEGAR